MIENKYETIAKFTDENCTFTVKQPIKDSPEKLKKYYDALARAAFKQHFKLIYKAFSFNLSLLY